MVVLNCTPESASVAPVQKTGQTTSYAAGDDGALSTGITWPNPRFKDNGDGTLVDNLTGLIWLKNANCDGTKSWQNPLTFVASIHDGVCGLNDSSVPGEWRLPNIRELHSLVNFGAADSAVYLNSSGFVAVQSKYWSSTTDANLANEAWDVNLSNGDIGGHGKVDPGYVLAVR